MGVIRSNERELAGKICQWFNEEINRGGYPFKSASIETGIAIEKSKTYFGDIIIWESDESRIPYTLLELKRPFGHSENLERLKKKALELKVKIVYTWNFHQLNAYKIVGNELILQDSDSCSVLTTIEDWRRGDIQVIIKGYTRKICEELISVSKVGRFSKFKPDKFYFVQFIRNIVNRLIPIYEEYIKIEHRQKEKRDIINKYGYEQGIAYPSDEEFFYLIACQSVYGVITKIIFYLTIRRYFKELPDLLNPDYSINESLKIGFAAARDKDWQSVFMDGPIDELGLPEAVALLIEELLANLKIYNFGELPEDVVGELFEDLIEPNHRHALGQYFTKENLVDLIIGTIVHDPQKIYADPTCGSGTFLIRLYSRLKYLQPRLKHEELLLKIWGVDIGKFPAELSTINLFRQDPSNFENFPRVIHKDIFKLFPGDEFEFPPPTSGSNYNKIKIPLPSFYGFVGNFPFIRQELIEKKVKGYKSFLTSTLAKDYLTDYPELFIIKNKQIHLSKDEVKNKSNEVKESYIEYAVKNAFIELKLSGQADIYTYIFIHVSSLLETGGSIAVITSNSWLDVAYGAVLKQFLLNHFKIKMIVASWAEPWFEDASVNTVFTVVEKCDQKNERENNLVHFVKIKKPLAELIPFHDLKLESLKRWQRIDLLVRKIESSYLSAKSITPSIAGFEDDDFRIRLITQESLQREINKDKELSKWGKYLRAPDIYFEIIERLKDKLVPLKTLGDVRVGIKTGINDFFYLNSVEKSPGEFRNARNWQGKIESEYLRKVIKSPKESDSIQIDPEKLKNLLFVCNKSKEELRMAGHFHALNYIEWGEKQRTTENVLWKEVQSVASRKHWYGLSMEAPGSLLMQMVNNDRFLIFQNNHGIYVDHNLFEYIISDKKVRSFASAYLNSSLFALIKEVNSRVNLGDGATKTEGVDWKNLMLIPKDTFKIKFNDKSFYSRRIQNIQNEVKQKDRQKLDKEIIKSLGLDDPAILKRIYDGLVEIVTERLLLPKLRKKQQSQKVRKSYSDVKRSVIEECIGSFPKKFPESFYAPEKIGHFYENLDFEVVNTSGKQLKDEYFLGFYSIYDADKQLIYETDSIQKVQFIKLLVRPNKFQLIIPQDQAIIYSILENYRNYISTLKEMLLTNANQKLHSWNDAEKMTDEILKDYYFNE
jgi:type I restriction enzyme M protein